MELYVARHGQTAYNAEELACGGQTDIPLTEVGKAQARELGEKLVGIPIDVVIASPLMRAQETARIAVSSAKQDPFFLTDSHIKEHCFGAYEGVDMKDPVFSEIRWEASYRFDGGESLFDLAARVYPFLESLPRRFPDKTVLLVCHGAVARMISSYYKSFTAEEFRSFWMGNCDLLHFSVPGNGLTR